MKATQYLGDFFVYLRTERGAAKNTLIAYEIDLRTFFAWCRAKKIDPLRIRHKMLRRFLGDQAIKHSDVTASRRLAAIKMYFRFLVLEEVLKIDSTQFVTMRLKPRKLPRSLEVSEVHRLILTANGTTHTEIRDRAIMEFAYATGTRISEIVDLRRENINWVGETVLILGKGSKERVLPLVRQCVYWLSKYDEVRAQWGNSQEPIFFLNALGRPFGRQGMWRLLKGYAAKSGINKRITPHIIRHSFATHLIKSGANLKAVQMLMGHKSINTTARYIHLDAEDLLMALIQHHPRG